MIKYRPQRGGLAEAMAEMKTFETVEEMKKYVSETSDDWYKIRIEDISLGQPHGDDWRIGWRNVRYVLAGKLGEEVYDPPLAIGYCSID